LNALRKKSLEKAIDNAYIRILADKNGVKVEEKDIDSQIALLRKQNRIGQDQQTFEQVLKDYWNWTENDFRRSLRQELLAQKLVAKLDTGALDKIKAARAELDAGGDFAAVVAKYSEDPVSRNSGGDFGFLVEQSSTNVPPVTIETLFGLTAGQYSQPIDIGYGVEVVKVTEINDTKRKASHIVINYKDLAIYLNAEKDKNPTHKYID
jgi:hypothetical protein